MPKKHKVKPPKENKETLENQNHQGLMESISASMEGEAVSKGKKRRRILSQPRQMSFGFLMLVGVPLAWSVVAGLISTTEFERDYFVNLIQVAFVVGILGLIFTYKWVAGLALGGLALFIFFTLVGFFYPVDPPSSANEFATLLTYTVRYVTGIENHTMAYQQVVIWVVTVAISLFVVFFTYYRFVFIVLFTVLSVTFGLLVTSAYFSYPRSFLVYIICVLVLLVRQMHQRSSDKATRRSPYTRLILPITVACFFLVGFAPMPEQGTMQGPVRTAILQPFNYINEAFYNVTQRRDFSIRQIGFGGIGGQLGGSVEVNHEVFMRVRTEGEFPLYLTGATSATYTGYSWLNPVTENTPLDYRVLEQNLELLERLISEDVIRHPSARAVFYPVVDARGRNFAIYSTPGYTHGILGRDGTGLEFFADDGMMRVEAFRFFEPYSGRIEVDVMNFRPSFVFHTGILRGVAADDESISFYRDREGRVTTNQRFQRHARYEVVYSRVRHFPGVPNLEPYYSFNGLLSIMAQELENQFITAVEFDGGSPDFSYTHILVDYVINLQVGEENHIISQRDLINNYLIPRRDQIVETYLQLPEDFPQRIRERAIEVTEGAGNNYHMMRLLEQYLSENYAYTLHPGQTPADVDFVYHFLFDLQAGHCVYFATTFVVMARSLGMPARYVEGFLVNGVPRGDGFVNVLNSMAHAWPEVYFEGYGWHQFEPTPASGLPQLREVPEGAGEDWNPWMDPEFIGEGWDGEPAGLEGLEPDFGQDTLGEPGATRTGTRAEGAGLSFWGAVGLILLVSIILMAIRALWVHLQYIGWRRKENKGAVVHAFESILSCLKIFNYQMRDGETPFRFMERVCNKRFLTNVDEKKRLEQTVEIYGKARYSNQEISREERQIVERTVRGLERRTKSYLGYPKYYFYRFILARI